MPKPIEKGQYIAVAADSILSSKDGTYYERKKFVQGQARHEFIVVDHENLPCIFISTPQDGPSDSLSINKININLRSENGEYILLEASMKKKLEVMTGDPSGSSGIPIQIDEDMERLEIGSIQHTCHIHECTGFDCEEDLFNKIKPLKPEDPIKKFEKHLETLENKFTTLTKILKNFSSLDEDNPLQI